MKGLIRRLAWGGIVFLGFWFIATVAMAIVLFVPKAHGIYHATLFDQGHRVFGVSSDLARQVVVKLLRDTAGLDALVRIAPGPTDQTILEDGMTAINYIRDRKGLEDYAATAISAVVDDPARQAQIAAERLNISGFVSEWKIIMDPADPEHPLAVVKSEAFDGWVLVFRHYVRDMAEPPKLPLEE